MKSHLSIPALETLRLTNESTIEFQSYEWNKTKREKTREKRLVFDCFNLQPENFDMLQV